MSKLKTRKPTGLAPWPFILLEGAEKSGKSYAAAALSCSPRVGPVYWFDLGEGAADEYGALPGASYEVVEHNGSYGDILDQLQAALALPVDPKRPTVLVLDSMTELWAMLVDQAQNGRPGARVNVNQWGVAKQRWRAIVDRLKGYPGIVVVTARGKEALVMEGNAPVEGAKTWKVEAEKSLPYDATVVVRMPAPRQAWITGVRSLHVDMPTDGSPLKLDGDFSLERLIFDVLALGPGQTGARDFKAVTAVETPEGHITSDAAKLRVIEAVRTHQPFETEEVQRTRAVELWTEYGLPMDRSATVEEVVIEKLVEDLAKSGKVEERNAKRTKGDPELVASVRKLGAAVRDVAPVPAQVDAPDGEVAE